jgi:DNA repair exonuclease SbcCD ATPase subunit
LAETTDDYDRIAREAIEHALGHTFENPEAVPRRDAFIRDATDLLARFVAARCGNPGFHSARFFDAVIALSNARTRIRDAARRSRVVERLVEAERRVHALERALHDRNEQLVQAAAPRGESEDGAQLATLARALADADARIRTLERELSDERNKAAAGPDGEGAGAEDGRADEATLTLDRLDAAAITAGVVGRVGAGAEDDEVTDKFRLEVPPPPAAAAPPPPAAAPERTGPGGLVLDPERRIAALKAEQRGLEEEVARMKTAKEQVELERDALQAQIDQLTQREAPLREAKLTLGRERDSLVARVGELERERDSVEDEKRALERDRDEVIRSRSALGELKRSADQELTLAQQEREQLREIVSEKDAARARATAEAERAHEARRAAEQRIDRESTTAARARRERDDARTERDRLKAGQESLRAFKERWESLAQTLGAEPDSPLEAVLAAIARRHEVVLAHEPLEWDALRGRVERLREQGDGIASHADAWLTRLADARSRYETLLEGTENGNQTASALLEIARLVTTHADDLRTLDLIETLL